MAGRPKEFDPDEALAAATEAFWKRGYEGVGMEALLREMGVSRQSAYDTFGGKRALFLAALQCYVGRVREQVGGVLRDETASPATRVRRFLDGVVKQVAGGSEKGCLLTNSIVELAARDADVRRIASEALKALEEALEGVISAGQKGGEIPAAHRPRALARLIVVAFEGALVMSKSDRAGSVRDGIEVVKSLIGADE